jgi:AraC-like DNA-binding protein
MDILDILRHISVVAIIHGLFLAALLFSYRKGNTRANRLLGLFMTAFSVILSYTVVYHTPLVFLTFPFLYLLGPLFYFYVKHLTRPGLSMTGRVRAHFIPFALALAFMAFAAGGGYYDYIATKGPFEGPITIAYWSLILVFIQIQMGVYIYLTWRLIEKHRRRIEEIFSTVDIINLSWLRHSILSLVIVITASLVLTVILPRLGFPERACDMTASLVISLFIFALGYRGLLQPEIFTSVTDSAATPVKYRRSSINRDEADRYVTAIERLMEEEKLYADPDLTLDDIARKISVSRHLLSMLLNETAGTNFYDFINSYRLERVTEYLKDPKKRDQSILEIAFGAGFNSKSTFNTVFKRKTGMTPTEYRMRHT